MSKEAMMLDLVKHLGHESTTTIMFCTIAEKASWDFTWSLYCGIMDDIKGGML